MMFKKIINYEYKKVRIILNKVLTTASIKL